MIFAPDRRKLYMTIIAIILIPLFSIGIINMWKSFKSQPTSNMTTELSNEDSIVLDKSIQQESDFLSEYRMERERVRSKEIEMLKEIANNSSSTEKAREAAYLKLVDLADKEEKELQAEVMIKSQGYQDCAVIMTTNNTTVMLKGNNPTTAEQEKIKRSVSIAVGCTEKTVSVVKLQQ